MTGYGKWKKENMDGHRDMDEREVFGGVDLCLFARRILKRDLAVYAYFSPDPQPDLSPRFHMVG